MSKECKINKQCKYYPCHTKVQDCRYCVCPFYPCRIEGLGEWIEIESRGKIWDCTNCNLPHRKEFIEMIEEIREQNKKNL